MDETKALASSIGNISHSALSQVEILGKVISLSCLTHFHIHLIHPRFTGPFAVPSDSGLWHLKVHKPGILIPQRTRWLTPSLFSSHSSNSLSHCPSFVLELYLLAHPSSLFCLFFYLRCITIYVLIFAVVSTLL